MARLLVFCEAPADFRTIAGLVERAVREGAPGWVVDLLDAGPEAAAGVLSWVPDSGHDRTFFDIHNMKEYAKRHDVRIPHGHFEGRPGAAGALMARTAFWLVRALTRKGEAVETVLLVCDMDHQGDARRAGLEQARVEARGWASFKIVLGCPDRMREAWVLAGFEPESQEERSRLERERRELGFCPCKEAHSLDAQDAQAKRSPKRALAALSGGDHEREERCWTSPSLDTLRERGGGSGLSAFLGEVTETIAPLAWRPAQAPRG